MQDTDLLARIRLALHAALADGVTSTAERTALERFRQLSPETLPSIDEILTQFQNRRLGAAELVAPFTDGASRQEAWMTCLTVCEADGSPSAAERWFLDEIRAALKLDPTPIAATEAAAGAMAALVPPAFVTQTSTGHSVITPDGAALDKTILNHALLAGGLELLPDSLATMTILPVQMRLVYEVGKAHGVGLDRGHIVEFLGVVGVGVASQVIERFAARWISGLAGSLLGGIGRSVAGQFTSSGMSFATTYALGELARQYYGGGRRLGAIELKNLFTGLMDNGRRLQQQYLPMIQQQAQSLRGANLAQLVQRL